MVPFFSGRPSLQSRMAQLGLQAQISQNTTDTFRKSSGEACEDESPTFESNRLQDRTEVQLYSGVDMNDHLQITASVPSSRAAFYVARFVDAIEEAADKDAGFPTTAPTPLFTPGELRETAANALMMADETRTSTDASVFMLLADAASRAAEVVEGQQAGAVEGGSVSSVTGTDVPGGPAGDTASA